jgi:ribonucleoside-diphosphate reductase alpha chain
VELAKQRGKFPIFHSKNEKDHAFLSKLPAEILEEMVKHGRRNIACLTTAPAGSVSNLSRCAEGKFGTTSGFEPVFMASYTRKKKMASNETKEPDSVGVDGERFEHFHVQHPGLQLFCDVTGKTFEDSPYYGSQANEINYKNRVLLQGMATGYVDHAISSTVNLPQDIEVDTVADIYMQAWQSGCKGITVYRDGSRDGILVATGKSQVPSNCENCDDAAEKFKALVKQGGRPQRVILSSAPKRPKDLECDIIRTTVKGQQWVFLVGKLNGQPYEIFGGANDDLEVPKKFKTGWIQKDGKHGDRSMYDLVLGSLENDGEKVRLVINNIASVFGSYGHATFSRVVSLTLRHGIPIKFICEQLIKDPEDDFQSYNRALARVLKSYIEEGEQSGLECPNCHAAKMVYKGGCPSCMVCGTSSCS